ncbi:ATP-binding cassette domain-containing protein [Stieleria marina]|uniref:Beta-(1-->2)glucan export ATP-binding/permease protein NdvA n=1 Tax=Stieleria marina TaxID=1930275 RepID=A0A517NQY4_9BACT|nr:Beta-(1-->2)glucan export ATP-binding/permease protein NdvA [Planctomycetes bacterium K23_9]
MNQANSLQPDSPSATGMRQAISDATIYMVVSQLGHALGIPVERSGFSADGLGKAADTDDQLERLMIAGRHAGISIKEAKLINANQIFDLISEGYPVLICDGSQAVHVLKSRTGRKLDGVSLPSNQVESYSRRRLSRLLKASSGQRMLVAKQELECATLSSLGMVTPGGDDDHDHMSPLQRFMGLLNLDRRDLWMVALFALVGGVLSLATPLAIESLVNVVSWGTYWQPLLVLSLLLLTCLGLSGIMKILQTVVTEIIQRRQLVRIVGDLAHRFPRANQQALQGSYPRELANRVFDIMTIQKATSVLLMDGVSLALTTMLGLLLLAFYHPFLLGFDLVLLLTMIIVLVVLGRGGVRTAIEESITKYRIVAWLQDVIALPTAFKVNGGETYAIDHANRLATDYLIARKSQFRVILRQVVFAVGLQVVASTVLLGLGGWLVIRGQLTLGQLVASELVVTVVVGAFAKAGKSLEKFYDLMAGIDKVGHLLDVPIDDRRESVLQPDGAGAVRWDTLTLVAGAQTIEIPETEIQPGSRVAVVGECPHGKSALMRVLAGLVKPQRGLAEIAGADALQAGPSGEGQIVGFAGDVEIFNGTLRQNVALGRNDVGRDRIRKVLQDIGLWDGVLRLSDGVESILQTGGYPLTKTQASLLMIARAIASEPSVVLIDGLLDPLGDAPRRRVWEAISGDDKPWTLIVSTNRQDVADLCRDRVTVRVKA